MRPTNDLETTEYISVLPSQFASYKEQSRPDGYIPTIHSPKAANRWEDRKRQSDLFSRFRYYQEQGLLVLAVTLSTCVTSDFVARSERFSQIWSKHFIEKLHKRLPKNLKTTSLDYEYLIEQSPDGYWHFHGFVAVAANVAARFWTTEGLNHHLKRDLNSFRKAGKYRSCRVNSFLIEPVTNCYRWSNYCTKSKDAKIWNS